MVSLPSSIIPRRHPIAEGIDRYMERNGEQQVSRDTPETIIMRAEITRLNHENEELTEQLHTAKHELAIERRAIEIILRNNPRHPVCDQAPD